MKKPSQQSVMGLGLALMTFLTSYLGYDKYEQSQVVVQPTEVSVEITSMPATATHAHRSAESIQAMIDKSLEARMNHHVKESGRH